MVQLPSEKGGTVLFVEADGARRFLVERSFSASGLCIHVASASSAEEALSLLGSLEPDLILAARRLPDSSGIDLMARVRELRADLPLFILDPEQTEESALESMRRGAGDYLALNAETVCKLPYLAFRVMEEARARRRLLELVEDRDETRAAVSQVPAEGRSRDLASISHDLRTPLAGLIGLLDLLEGGMDGDLLPAQSERLARMRAMVDRIVSLTEQVADLALVEAGRLTLSRGPVSLSECVQLARRDLDPMLRSRAVTLHVAVPADLPPLRGDAQRIQQIITALVSSALRLAEGTSIELLACPRGSMVEVTLREVSRGIPVEVLPPDFPGPAGSHDSDPDAAEIRGLSFSVARGLVALHGGSLNVARDADGGIHALFTLPVEQTEPIPLAERTQDLRPRP